MMNNSRKLSYKERLRRKREAMHKRSLAYKQENRTVYRKKVDGEWVTFEK